MCCVGGFLFCVMVVCCLFMFDDRLIDRGQGVLVAVSGGADSVALLDMLVRGGYRCVVGHCNFHLRGEESMRDEVFVRGLCGRLGVELLVKDFDTLGYARGRGVSVEMAARELRYGWFEEVLDGRGLGCVAVAHHGDDAAETTILNIARGTGIRGLTGMKARVGRVVRPLLGMSRVDIEDYCRLRGLDFVVDSSNLSDEFKRNRVRHEVMPALKAINPSVLRAMRGMSERLGEVYEVYRGAVEGFRWRHVSVEGDGALHIDAEALRGTGVAGTFLYELTEGRGFSSDQVRRAGEAVMRGDSGKLFFSRGCRMLVDRREVVVEDRVMGVAYEDVRVWPPVRVYEEGRSILFEERAWGAGDVVSRDGRVMQLNAARLRYPLVLRHWRRGDRFRPLGMRGEKKLSDFFVDLKLSLLEKGEAEVLVSGEDIVCVVGVRPDERYRVTGDTCRVLVVSILDC